MESWKDILINNYKSFRNTLEHDTLASELIIYGTSSIMLLVACAKQRPLYLVRSFTKSSQIPDILIKGKMKHVAIIKDIQQKGHDTILLANHRPLIPLFVRNNYLLPIKLAGVHVTGNGFTWLQHTLIGRKTYFVPLHKPQNYIKDDDCVICQVYLIESTSKERYNNKELEVDIAELLINMRFARLENYYFNDASTHQMKYYKHLAKLDAAASRREELLKFLNRVPKISKYFYQLKAFILPKDKLLPKLMR